MTMVRDYGRGIMDDASHSIGAGEFKARCLKLLDEVAQTRQPLIITKHGKPVAQLTPLPPKKSPFGLMAGSVLYEGDIISPIDVEWNANK